MATKTISWNSGTGNITVTYDGSGDGTAVITSSDNDLYEARSQQITFQTTAGSPQVTRTVTITQAAKINYATRYFTFVPLEASTFTFTNHGSGNDIQYSIDEGSTWVSLASATASPSVAAGSKIMWKSTRTPGNASGDYGVGTFSSTGRFDVEGNAMSLLFGDDFIGKVSLSGKRGALGTLFEGCTTIVDASNMKLPATTTVFNCYFRMFKNCTSLVGAPELPATTLTGIEVYYEMFYGCTSLTTAPNLPATTLTTYCYYNMFQNCSALTTVQETLPATTLQQSCYSSMFHGCSSLVVAPKLPATTLQTSCYYAMFRFCSSLTTAPELPAETLVTNCYYNMFYGCTNLNYIKCLATDISATGCTTNWVSQVAANGTFIKDASMTGWTTGNSGIPTGWTVETASS